MDLAVIFFTKVCSMEMNKSEGFNLDATRFTAFIDPGMLFMVLPQVGIPDPCR